ncbi:MAG: SCP2 sterol-binding domain-containing protein [Lentisphaeria bacterium]|nr:SCP2 sterol-binding domain-containing protein [Lentisphaeria bacterium]
MSFAADYMNGFLKRHLGRPLLDGLDHYSACFAIHFRDLERSWHVDVVNGRLQSVTPVAVPERPVVFEIDAETFREIVAARLSPQAAFFARRTDIRGDLFQGLKTAKVLSLFFQKYPCRETSP